jgi:hypothetical protein
MVADVSVVAPYRSLHSSSPASSCGRLPGAQLAAVKGYGSSSTGPLYGVTVGVTDGVGVRVDDSLFVGVRVDDSDLVCVRVSLIVGVGVRESLMVCVGVLVAVLVSLMVCDDVRESLVVGVGVLDGVRVSLMVAVGVRVSLIVGVGVLVSDDDSLRVGVIVAESLMVLDGDLDAFCASAETSSVRITTARRDPAEREGMTMLETHDEVESGEIEAECLHARPGRYIANAH